MLLVRCLLLHFLANLLRDLLHRLSISAGLISENYANCSNDPPILSPQWRLYLVVPACLVDLKIVFARADTTKIVLVPQLADPAKIRCDDIVLRGTSVNRE